MYQEYVFELVSMYIKGASLLDNLRYEKNNMMKILHVVLSLIPFHFVQEMITFTVRII